MIRAFPESQYRPASAPGAKASASQTAAVLPPRPKLLRRRSATCRGRAPGPCPHYTRAAYGGRPIAPPAFSLPASSARRHAPFVAQALLPAFFCAELLPMQKSRSISQINYNRPNAGNPGSARPCSHRGVQSTLANFGRTQILSPSLAVTTLLARSAHLVRVRAQLGARDITGAGSTWSPLIVKGRAHENS